MLRWVSTGPICTKLRDDQAYLPPPYELPVEFWSPYSVNECANRLQALISQDFLKATVEGLLVTADNKRIDFRLHAHSHQLMAASRYSNDLIEAEIVGCLGSNDDGSTYVSVDEMITGGQFRLYLVKLAVVAFVIGMIGALVLSHLLGFSAFGGLGAAIIAPLIVWYQRPYDVDKLIDLLKSTLEAALIESAE